MENDQLIPYINASPRLPLIIGQQDESVSLTVGVLATSKP